MRKFLIAGNWKMHGSVSQTDKLIGAIKQGMHAYEDIDILVFPSFVHLPQAQALVRDSALLLGAQNLYTGTQGAYTGEVSAPMLKEIGCDYVLIGHSERRTLFHENLALVAAKFKAACLAGLKPVLCIGETQHEREQGKTEAVIQAQLESVIQAAGMDKFQQAVIAYEPVWAIGTGLTATPEQAQEAHAFIRQLIMQNNVDIGKTIRILYGGSMKAENAAQLLAKPDIDGGLIGGASLEATSFLAICAAAHQEKQLSRVG